MARRSYPIRTIERIRFPAQLSLTVAKPVLDNPVCHPGKEIAGSRGN